MVLTAGACVLAFTASQHASTNTMSTSAAGSAQSVPQSTTALSPHATKPNEPSLAGDAASLLAAVVFVGYLHAGRTLRQFMPVFVYACPITSFAAAILTLSGMLFEGSSLLGIGARTQLGMSLYVCVLDCSGLSPLGCTSRRNLPHPTCCCESHAATP